MMIRRSPTIPPGPYPQLLLYPQVGKTPINASINRTISIVPRLITSSFLRPRLTRFFMKRVDKFRFNVLSGGVLGHGVLNPKGWENSPYADVGVVRIRKAVSSA